MNRLLDLLEKLWLPAIYGSLIWRPSPATSHLDTAYYYNIHLWLSIKWSVSKELQIIIPKLNQFPEGVNQSGEGERDAPSSHNLRETSLHSVLFSIRVVSSSLFSPPASFFNTSTLEKFCLPLLLWPCVGSQSINGFAGTSGCRTQWPANAIFSWSFVLAHGNLP